MASPLYQELAYQARDRQHSEDLRRRATLAGVAFGGLVVARIGIMKALLLGGILQMLSNLMYVAQVFAGHDNLMLTLSIFGENFTNGMGSAAFVAYCRACAAVIITGGANMRVPARAEEIRAIWRPSNCGSAQARTDGHEAPIPFHW